MAGGTVLGRLVGRAADVIMDLRSPSEVLGKDPLGREMWQRFDRGYRGMLVMVNKHMPERVSNMPFAKGSAEAETVGALLDKEVLPNQVGQLPPDIARAYQWTKSQYSKYADIGGLPPERRVKNYLTHIFDKDELTSATWTELQEAIKSGNATRARSLADTLNKIAKGQKLNVYEDLPQSLRATYFEKRKGKQGYSLDAVQAHDQYLLWLARKVHLGPAIEFAADAIPKMPSDLQPYARWYVRDMLGLDRSPGSRVAAHIRNAMFVKTIGFNPKTAIVNLTQQINNVAELGPRYTMEGIKAMFTPEGRAFLKESGHLADLNVIHTLSLDTSAGQKWDKILEWSGKMFNKVETANRGTAYLGALAKTMDVDSAGLANAIRSGRVTSEMTAFADEVVRRTQFRYGRVDLPRFFRRPIGSLLGQFSTFSIKQAELMIGWAKREPSKLLAYAAVAQGVNTTADKVLDVDLTESVGTGVDLLSGMVMAKSLVEGDMTEARAALKRMYAVGPGVLPSKLSRLGGPTLGVAQEMAGITERLGAVAMGQTTLGAAKKYLLRDAERLFVPVTMSKVMQAARDFRSGGDETSFVKAAVGFPGSESVVRRELLRLYEEGQFGPAKRLRAQFKKTKGYELPLASDQISAAIKKHYLRRVELAKARAQTDRMRIVPEGVMRRID